MLRFEQKGVETHKCGVVACRVAISLAARQLCQYDASGPFMQSYQQNLVPTSLVQGRLVWHADEGAIFFAEWCTFRCIHTGKPIV